MFLRDRPVFEVVFNFWSASFISAGQKYRFLIKKFFRPKLILPNLTKKVGPQDKSYGF